MLAHSVLLHARSRTEILLVFSKPCCHRKFCSRMLDILDLLIRIIGVEVKILDIYARVLGNSFRLPLGCCLFAMARCDCAR